MEIIMSPTHKAAGRMHILFQAAFKIRQFYFTVTGTEPKPWENYHEKSSVKALGCWSKLEPFISGQSVAAVLQKGPGSPVGDRLLNSWPLYSQYSFFVLFSFFVLLEYTITCQKRNPNLFLGIPGWPNKLFVELLSLPIAQLSLHRVLLRVSVVFRCLCSLLTQHGLPHWERLLAPVWTVWESVNLLLNSLHASAACHSRQHIPNRSKGGKRGSKGVAKVLPNESHTLRVLVRTDLLPAGKLKVFSVSTLEQRNEIRCLSSTSNPAVSSEMCKSRLGK